MTSPATDYYFRRFGFCERLIATPPRSDLGIVVVIPCFNEPDLIGSLESLWLCERPNCSVEVIVVINSPSGCSEEIRSQNQATSRDVAEWAARRRDPCRTLHLFHFPELPPKRAGVGLARKIGMDEALRRFDDVGRLEGIMVGYDADCRCATNYLGAIERHFEQHPQSPGCSICFEHPLSGMLSAQIYQAVTAYELHLRYYVQALRFSGFPHADFTIGSCMAVRAEAYRGQGGMNKRKAGEDFYFLHKIIPLGGFTALTGTTVYPSPRPSERVPFGTGKAVRDILSGREIKTYPLEAFLDLKRLVDCVPRMYQRERPAEPLGLEELPASMRAFLTEQQSTAALTEIRRNVSSEAAFCKRFFQWFDGIRARKFVHHARDRFYGEGGLREQAGRLLGAMNCLQTRDSNLALGEMLQIYRNCDRMPGLRTSWAQCAPDPRIAR